MNRIADRETAAPHGVTRRIPPPWVILCAALALTAGAVYLIFGRPFLRNISLVRKIEGVDGIVQFEEGISERLANVFGHNLRRGMAPITAVCVFPGPGKEPTVREIVAELQDRQSILGLQLDLTDEELARLNCPQLSSLNLFQSASDAGMAQLQRFPELQSLDLDGCRITDAGLAELRALPNLNRIEITDCTAITDKGLESLAEMVTLEYVRLSNCPRVTDDGLRRLAGLAALKSVTLVRCPLVTDDGLAHLAGSAVQYVDLQLCAGISGRGFEAFQGAGLKRVFFHGPMYGDDLIPHLAAVSHVRRIEFYDTSVTPAGADRLRQALPACDVELRLSANETGLWLKTAP